MFLPIPYFYTAKYEPSQAIGYHPLWSCPLWVSNFVRSYVYILVFHIVRNACSFFPDNFMLVNPNELYIWGLPTWNYVPIYFKSMFLYTQHLCFWNSPYFLVTSKVCGSFYGSFTPSGSLSRTSLASEVTGSGAGFLRFNAPTIKTAEVTFQ